MVLRNFYSFTLYTETSFSASLLILAMSNHFLWSSHFLCWTCICVDYDGRKRFFVDLVCSISLGCTGGLSHRWRKSVSITGLRLFEWYIATNSQYASWMCSRCLLCIHEFHCRPWRRLQLRGTPWTWTLVYTRQQDITGWSKYSSTLG